MEMKKHTPFRLTKVGYHKLCKLVDKRDGGCIICRRPNVQHHHIIFRSEGGEDRIENLVSLCPRCHEIYAHGENKHLWQSEFKKYISWPVCKRFEAGHRKELTAIYKLKEG